MGSGRRLGIGLAGSIIAVLGGCASLNPLLPALAQPPLATRRLPRSPHHQRRLGTGVPVIFLAVRSGQADEEAGLLGGAVDFIEKSRKFPILLRRIELIVGGAKVNDANRAGLAVMGQLSLDHDSKHAAWTGTALGLTLAEFRIVALLAERGGKDVSYREIHDMVHGEGFAAGEGVIGHRTNVRAFIKPVRQKFRDADPGFDAIQNYPSFGYRWHDPSI